MRIDERKSAVARIAHSGIERDLSEQFKVVFFSDLLSCTDFEDISDLSAVRADVTAHVLNYSENFDVRFFAEVDRLSDIGCSDFLRSRNEDSAGEVFNYVDERKKLVAGSGRRIDNDIVQGSPVDIFEELLDHSVFYRASPDYRIVGILKEKADRHDLERAESDRYELVVLADIDFAVLHAEHRRNARSVKVDIEKTDGFAVHSKRHRDVYGNGTFADAAFA